MQKNFFRVFHRFLERLSSAPKVGALHLQSGAFSYLRLDGATEAFSVKVEPGALREGRIADRGRVLAALVELRAQIGGGAKKGEEAKIVAIIPSDPIYTQSVNIPNVGKERLAESASLNLQMISPMGRDDAYMRYELLGEVDDHYELLAAFAEKRIIDEFQSVFREAGFTPVIFEFSSLSLARLIARVRGLQDDITLGCYVSSDGLEFFIVKHGKLHFSYFHSWASLQGEAREISRELFEEVVTREVQKVVNFSLGKFKERPREMVLVTQGLEAEIKALIANRFGFSATTLETGGGFTPPWYVALGAALRAKEGLEGDEGINLAPLSSRDRMFQEQTIGFVRLWRNVIVGALALFVVFFSGAAYSLNRMDRSTEARLVEFTAHFNAGELTTLAARADEFNTLVRSVASAAGDRAPWDRLLRTLERTMKEHSVTLDRIEIAGRGSGATLAARAPSNERLLSFKNALASAEGFAAVNLSVARIATLEDGSVGFALTFTPTVP
ncbi:MAG: hypothetical protein HYU81_02370 [Candidatus Brennerbacteria bacterium]|nr:hypothetical protein [Candidatus Brennerbacteria bacterium]